LYTTVVHVSNYCNPQQELSGRATPQTYTAVLRTLTYEHSDADPGNPNSTIARYRATYVKRQYNVSRVCIPYMCRLW